MSISTYSELKSAIASWMKRSDLTDQIHGFISIAEKRVKKVIQLRNMETEQTLSSVTGSSYIALPSDYQSPIYLVDIASDEKITQLSPTEVGNPVTSGIPHAWCIDSDNIKFDVLSESARTYRFRYVAKFELSDSAPTNYLLTEYPSIYLYGALVEACNYVFDDGRAAMWQQRLTAEIELANTNEARRYANVPLRTEFMQTRFNIYQGQ